MKRQHLGDKASVVDVLALDNDGHLYQVDLQAIVQPHLEKRMAYNWSSLLSRQLKKGAPYASIKPVVSIWLLKRPLFPHLPQHLHPLRLSDPETEAIIMAQSMVCIVEFSELRFRGPVTP